MTTEDTNDDFDIPNQWTNDGDIDPPEPVGDPDPAPVEDDRPARFKDKSWEEIEAEVKTNEAAVEAARKMFEVIGRGNAVPGTPTPAPAPEPIRPPVITQEDLLEGDADAVQRKMDDWFAAKSAPLIGEHLKSRGEQNYNNFFQAYPDLKPYEAQVRQAASSLTIAQAAEGATWRLLAGELTRANFDDIAARKANGNPAPTTTPAPTTARPTPSHTTTKVSTPNPAGPNHGLTDEELKIARRLGVKPERWAHFKNMGGG